MVDLAGDVTPILQYENHGMPHRTNSVLRYRRGDAPEAQPTVGGLAGFALALAGTAFA